MVAGALSKSDLLLTCVNEDGIHIDFGTERAQNKSTGWSKYQHREQDSCKKKRKVRLKRRSPPRSEIIKDPRDYLTLTRIC